MDDSLNVRINPVPKIAYELIAFNKSSRYYEIQIAESKNKPGKFFLTYSNEHKKIDTIYISSYQNFPSLGVSADGSTSFSLVFLLSNEGTKRNMFNLANEGELFYKSSKRVYKIKKGKEFKVIFRHSNNIGIE